MQKKRFLLSILCLVFSALLSACSGGQDGNVDSGVSFLDKAMTQTEIDALSAGEPAYAMVEREDGIKFIPITLGNRYTAGSSDYLTFRDADARFGFGDSGSPILNKEGKTIGALAGTFGGDNIAITPITSMLAIAGSSSTTTTSTTINNRLAWFAVGVNAYGRDMLRSVGIPVSDFDPRPVTNQAIRAATLADTAYTVAPGHSMAVVPFEGPIVNIYAIGTITHAVDADRMLAFGHSLNWDGQPNFSMPVTPAKIVQFVHDPLYGNFKLAVPVGSVQGGIIQDRSSAILVSRTANIQWFGLTVNAGGKTTTHRVCRLDDQYLMYNFVIVGLQNIVQGHLDVAYPGVLQTSIKITYNDNTTRTVDIGDVNWSYSGGWDVWYYLSAEFDTISNAEITLG